MAPHPLGGERLQKKNMERRKSKEASSQGLRGSRSEGPSLPLFIKHSDKTLSHAKGSGIRISRKIKKH